MEHSFRSSRTTRGRKNSTKISKKSSLTLAAIVILYIVCNTPRLILNLVDHFFSALTDFDFCNCKLNPFWVEFSVLVSHLFLVINSAVNFLIYFSISKMFKKVLLVKLRLVGKQQSQPTNDTLEVTKHSVDPNFPTIDLQDYSSSNIVMQV